MTTGAECYPIHHKLRQKAMETSATTTDRTKLRMGYLLVILNVLGFILAIIAIRSDLFYRAEKDSQERATTRVTLWKVIHCEIPAAAPSPNEKKKESKSTTSTAVSKKKKNRNVTAGNVAANTTSSSSSTTSNNQITDLTTQQCSYDTISEKDINWSPSLIQKFHVIIGFTVLSLVCRCGLLLFVVVVGGNVLKLFRFLHHDGNYNNTTTATINNNSKIINDSVVLRPSSFTSNSSSVENLAVSKGNAKVLRMHTSEGFGVLICYGIQIISQVVILALLLTLWTATPVSDIEPALQLHGVRNNDLAAFSTTSPANLSQANTNNGFHDDPSAPSSTTVDAAGGFRGAGFTMRLGFIIWIFFGFFELLVTVSTLLPFGCVMKLGSHHYLRIMMAGGNNSSLASSRGSFAARTAAGDLEQLEEAFLPSPAAVADDTAVVAIEMVSAPAISTTTSSSSTAVVVVDFDKSISREASIIPVTTSNHATAHGEASAVVYCPPSVSNSRKADDITPAVTTPPSSTTAVKTRIQLLEVELAGLKNSLVDSALASNPSSPITRHSAPVGGTTTTTTLEGGNNDSFISRTATETSI